MILNEFIVEDAALTWFGELGYAFEHGEPAVECESFNAVVLAGRLREAVRRLNRFPLPSRTLTTLRDVLLPQLLSGKLIVNELQN